MPAPSKAAPKKPATVSATAKPAAPPAKRPAATATEKTTLTEAAARATSPPKQPAAAGGKTPAALGPHAAKPNSAPHQAPKMAQTKNAALTPPIAAAAHAVGKSVAPPKSEPVPRAMVASGSAPRSTAAILSETASSHDQPITLPSHQADAVARASPAIGSVPLQAVAPARPDRSPARRHSAGPARRVSAPALHKEPKAELSRKPTAATSKPGTPVAAKPAASTRSTPPQQTAPQVHTTRSPPAAPPPALHEPAATVAARIAVAPEAPVTASPAEPVATDDVSSAAPVSQSPPATRREKPTRQKPIVARPSSQQSARKQSAPAFLAAVHLTMPVAPVDCAAAAQLMSLSSPAAVSQGNTVLPVATVPVRFASSCDELSSSPPRRKLPSPTTRRRRLNSGADASEPRSASPLAQPASAASAEMAPTCHQELKPATEPVPPAHRDPLEAQLEALRRENDRLANNASDAHQLRQRVQELEVRSKLNSADVIDSSFPAIGLAFKGQAFRGSGTPSAIAAAARRGPLRDWATSCRAEPIRGANGRIQC